MAEPSGPIVAAVASGAEHDFSKATQPAIVLIAGVGVDGDAHAGRTVQHLSRKLRTPDAPNLRQVHLIHGELHDELSRLGFDLRPGDMGENITTRGIDLLALPAGTRLGIGADAVVEVTGLRNPCVQLDRHQHGLMAAVLGRAGDGTLIRKAGVMAVVAAGGRVMPGDLIDIVLPPLPHHRLEKV